MMLDSILPEPFLRKWVQSIPFRQYLYHLSALIIGLLFTFIWGFLILKTNKELSFFAVVIALLNGFIAYLFMEYRNKYKLIFYSIFFSLISIIVARFFYFSHFINWELGAILNKDLIGLGLLLDYLKYFKGVELGKFINYFENSIDAIDYIYLIIIIISPFQYILFTENDDNEEEENLIKKDIANKKLMKRRFDF